MKAEAAGFIIFRAIKHSPTLRSNRLFAFYCLIKLVNDADAALLGECWVGAAAATTGTCPSDMLRGKGERGRNDCDSGDENLMSHSENRSSTSSKGSGSSNCRKDVCLITLGSGIGGSVLVGGRLVVGSRGIIEPGHTIVDHDHSRARPCGCGQKGCIEAYASANSILKRFEERYAMATTEYARAAMERAKEEERSSGEGHFRFLSRGGADAYGDAIAEAVAFGAEVDSTEAVFRFASKSKSAIKLAARNGRWGVDGDADGVEDEGECGDRLPAKVAAEVVNETARLLAVFLVNLCRSYDPSMILVGGGVAMAGNLLLDALRYHFEDQRWSVLPDSICLQFAQLKHEAGVVGAAAVVRNMLLI